MPGQLARPFAARHRLRRSSVCKYPGGDAGRARVGGSAPTLACALVRRAHLGINNTRFGSCLARVGNDVQLRLGPDLRQIPSVLQRDAHILATENNDSGNLRQFAGLPQDSAVLGKNAAILEIVTLNALESRREMISAECGGAIRIG